MATRVAEAFQWLPCNTMTFINPSASVGPFQNFKRVSNTRNMGRNKFMVALHLNIGHLGRMGKIPTSCTGDTRFKIPDIRYPEVPLLKITRIFPSVVVVQQCISKIS